MFVKFTDANPADPANPEIVINSDRIAHIWQHPTVGCIIDLDTPWIQNANVTETYAQVKTLLGI